MKIMGKISRSTKIYLALILILTATAALNIFLPQGALLPKQQLPAPQWLMALITGGIYLIVYGGLGFIGLTLARKVGFAELWDPTVSNRQRFLIPALVGAGLGLFFILVDALFAAWHNLGPLPHPPFPTSVAASIVAGIGEEIIFRLFFIPFWLWLVSALVLRGRWQTPIFWIVAVLSALAFAVAHLPAVMAIMGFESIQAIPLALIIELVILNGVLSLFAAYYLKTYGFLAAVGIHFWTDVLWHVIWGGVT